MALCATSGGCCSCSLTMHLTNRRSSCTVRLALVGPGAPALPRSITLTPAFFACSGEPTPAAVR
jgi:hypothetical protein